MFDAFLVLRSLPLWVIGLEGDIFTMRGSLRTSMTGGQNFSAKSLLLAGAWVATLIGGSESAAAGKQWNETILYDFKGPPDADHPMQYGSPSNTFGAIDGTSPYGGKDNAGTVWAQKGVRSRSDTIVYSFKGGQRDGAYPMGTLWFVNPTAWTGDVVGVTQGGGTYNWGTVFKLGRLYTSLTH
jgi:hypothetical protein